MYDFITVNFEICCFLHVLLQKIIHWRQFVPLSRHIFWNHKPARKRQHQWLLPCLKGRGGQDQRNPGGAGNAMVP